MRDLMARLRRMDDRAVPATAGLSRTWWVVALLAGLVAAGVPAVLVLTSGGPLLVAALLPLLAVIPVALVLLTGRR